ncbi:MAG: transcription antitermination factor NusB [Candidatus Omnitrophota bacterium]
MRKRTLARECALKVLYRIEIAREPAEDSIKDFWSKPEAPIDEQVRAFAGTLVNGTCENISEIDAVISRHADNWTISRMAVIDKNILRMAIFEMLFSRDIPPNVSINEAIELAKRYGDIDSGKFVNGILDKVKKTECKK